MNLKVETLRQYAKDHSVEEVAELARKLLGMDAEFGWKTNSNGKHYKVGKGGTVTAGPKAMVGKNVNTGRTVAKPRESETTNKFHSKKHVRLAVVGPPEDVTEEYKRSSKPGKGRVIEAPGYSIKDSPKGDLERSTADWIVATFGGTVTMNKQTARKGETGVKNPEYTWRNKLWELKEPEVPTATAINNNLHDALHQIKSNPGGVLMDITKCGASFELAEKAIYRRARQSAHFPVDVIIIKREDRYKVLRFKLEEKETGHANT